MWNTGGHYPELVLKLSKEDLGRVGNCWMKGRLLENDLIICTTHSGDCFWRYELIKQSGAYASAKAFTITYTYQRIPEAYFGAYVLGTKYIEQPTQEEFELFMSGQETQFTKQNEIKYCCQTMTRQVQQSCDQHSDRWECPDALITYSHSFKEYGLIIHDGGSSSIHIDFCPWCGKKLADVKA